MLNVTFQAHQSSAYCNAEFTGRIALTFYCLIIIVHHTEQNNMIILHFPPDVFAAHNPTRMALWNVLCGLETILFRFKCTCPMTDRLNVYLSKVVHTAFKAYSLLKVLDVKIGAKIMVGCYFCNLARFGERTTMASGRMKYSYCSPRRLFWKRNSTESWIF